MKNLNSVTSVPFLLVMGTIVGIGSIDNIVYGDSQKTQELQMHLDKVMDELNNNNTDAAKKHLEGAQNMIASMNDQNGTSIANNHTTSWYFDSPLGYYPFADWKESQNLFLFLYDYYIMYLGSYT